MELHGPHFFRETREVAEKKTNEGGRRSGYLHKNILVEQKRTKAGYNIALLFYASTNPQGGTLRFWNYNTAIMHGITLT